LVVGWTLIGCGLVASARRPESRSGDLMAAAGFMWFFGNFASAGVGVVAWAGAHTLYLHRGPLFHLLLAYPSGRPSSWLIRGAVTVGYAAAIVTPVWRNEVATIVLAAFLLGVSAQAYLRGVGRARRARLPALWGAAGLSIVLAGGAAARLAVP